MENTTIVDLGNSQWASHKMLDEMQKFNNRREAYIFLHYSPEHNTTRKEREQIRGNYKWCYVTIGNTRKLAMINELDGKVYKVSSNMEITNIEIKKYKFNRYCTSFDL